MFLSPPVEQVCLSDAYGDDMTKVKKAIVLRMPWSQPLTLRQAINKPNGQLGPTTQARLQNPDSQTIIDLDGRHTIFDATDLANDWINKTLRNLAMPVRTPCIDALLERHFRASSSQDKDKAVDEIKKALQQVSSGPYGINSPNVTYGIGGTMCFGGVMGNTPKGQSSETNICQDCWSETFRTVGRTAGRDLSSLARTLIHESLHRLHLLWGDGHVPVIDDVPNAYQKQVTMPRALELPDAYAMFAMEAATKC